MSRCKYCKVRIKGRKKFCGTCGQPVVKNRLSQTAKITIIVSVVVLLLMFVWVQRISIARLTDGKLFGYHTRVITAEEMDGEVAPPTEEETEEFLAYVADLQSYSERRLWGEKKKIYQETTAVMRMLTDCAAGESTLSLENIEKEFDRNLKDIKKDQNIFKNLLGEFLVVAGAEDLPEEVYLDKNLYLAYLLKNASSTLFVQGYTDISLAMASMATALAPQDSSMASLVANILKEYHITDTSYEMLHYALRLNPNDEAALHTLGMLCIDMGEYEEAERCFNRMLRLSGGTGPANQGWMLLALAEGDLASGYLYMLEGAREGYTHVITEVYEAFRARSDYFEIAGPIFDQYPLYELVKFERTKQIFDATLDTIEQQVVIDRKMIVCRDAAGSIIAQAENLLETKRYMEEMGGLIVGNLVDFLSTYGDEFAQLKNMFSDSDVTAFLKGDLTALWDIGKRYVAPEEESNVYKYNYEQEIFFLNILQDYMEYNFEKNLEKYMDAAMKKLDVEAEGTPVAAYVDRWEEYGQEVGEVMAYAQKWDGVEIGPHNYLAALMDWLPSLLFMNNNFETNGHGLFYGRFTVEQYTNLNRAAAEIAPMLEEGYLQLAILCEEYYLYTNNILGYIADDTIYNEWRYNQRLNVMFPLLYYPAAGFFYNEILAMAATMTYGSAAPVGDWDIHVPGTPEFPVTGMGTPTGEPEIIWEYKPPSTAALDEAADKLWEEAISADSSLGSGQEDEPVGGLYPEDGIQQSGPLSLEDVDPELYITLDPKADTVAEAETNYTTIITETVESPIKLKVPLGDIFSVTIDPFTGDISLSATSKKKLLSGSVKVNLDSGDVTLYGHLGPSIDGGPKFGVTSTNAASLRFGGYTKIVLDPSEMEISSAEIGADAGAEAIGFGTEVEVGYDLATGIKVDTASKIVGGVKTTIKNVPKEKE